MPTDSRVEERLRERGVRFTPSRRAVVGALLAADGPKSAAEVHDLLGAAIPLSSLYRSLAVLEDAGVLTPHHGARGVTRYEPAEWLSGHHHHLVCVICGAVEDVAVPAVEEQDLESMVVEIADRAGFSAANHVLEIEGRCARCA